jgi:hypothetical protein
MSLPQIWYAGRQAHEEIIESAMFWVKLKLCSCGSRKIRSG